MNINVKTAVLLATTTAMAVATVASTPRAHAAASTTEVTMLETTISQSAPTREWVEDGVLHLRGRTDVLAVSGSLSGTLTATLDINLHLATGDGDFSGDVVLATPSVTWDGSAHGQLVHGLASGSYVGQGTDGSSIRGAFSQISADTFSDRAVILLP